MIVNLFLRYQKEDAMDESYSTLWQIKTERSSARVVDSISKTVYQECPTVWRKWTKKLHKKAASKIGCYFVINTRILQFRQ